MGERGAAAGCGALLVVMGGEGCARGWAVWGRRRVGGMRWRVALCFGGWGVREGEPVVHGSSCHLGSLVWGGGGWGALV